MTTPNSDGTQVSPDSATSESTIEAAAEAAPEAQPKPANPNKEFLRSLGLTKRGAMRLIAGSKSSDYLNTKITARVLLVDHANSIENIMVAQRQANKYAKSKEFDGRTRASCLGVVAQCGMALARLSEVTLATARSLDAPEADEKAPVIQPTQNNFFGFPPVADMPPQTLQRSAKNGDVDATEVSATVKSP